MALCWGSHREGRYKGVNESFKRMEPAALFAAGAFIYRGATESGGRGYMSCWSGRSAPMGFSGVFVRDLGQPEECGTIAEVSGLVGTELAGTLLHGGCLLNAS